MAENEVLTPPVTEQPTTPESPPDQPEAPARVYTQKEVDEIAGKIKENAARKRAELRRDLETFKRMALDRERPAPTPQPQTPQVEAEPKLEQFASYDDYVKAVADHRAVKATDERLKQDRDQAEKRSAQERRNQLVASHREREAKALEKYEDYIEKAHYNPHMTEAMAQAIMESDVGPDVAYWLANNPQDSARIARLSPVQQIRELGKIEAKMESSAPPPAPKQPSTAPEPITPVGGKAGPSATDEPSDRDEIGAWIKKRQKQVHKR